MKRSIKLKTCLVLALVAVATFVAAFVPSMFTAKADVNTQNKYVLTFQDDFDGNLEDGWAYVKGGSSFTYATSGGLNVTGWNFGALDHIAYKTSSATDYGKFFYGTANSTDYAFEVKMRADVNETTNEFLTTYASNLGGNITVNTHIPFFVTNATPDANNHTFGGRSVCINNYSLGFYEYSYNADGTLASAGWAKQGSTTMTARIASKFDNFDWRDYHTIKVVANATECKVYIDDVLMVAAPQAAFTRATEARGYAGFAGVCGEKYVSLNFDDFKYWSKNADYDTNSIVTQPATALNVNDLTSVSTMDYYGSFASNLSTGAVISGNKITYKNDVGTELRAFKNVYSDFSLKMYLDMENQDTDKTEQRTSLESGIFFRTNTDTMTAPQGYVLSYYARKTNSSGTEVNTVQFFLRKFNGTSTSTVAIKDWSLISGRTDAYIDLTVNGNQISLGVYANESDLNAKTNALFTDTVTDNTYTKGKIGLKINAGTPGNAALNYIWEATFLGFSGTELITPPEFEAPATLGNFNVTISHNAGGSINVGSNPAETSYTVNAHDKLNFNVVANSGYAVEYIKINGKLSTSIKEINLLNVTKDYTVEVGFTDNLNVDVFILAGQSNAAGFTPTSGLYKEYTYGGTLDQAKLNEYVSGYEKVLYFGAPQSADPATNNSGLQNVRAGQGGTNYRFGPELGFAEEVGAYYGGTNGRAAVVKYAVGSTGFTNAVGSITTTYGNWMSPSLMAEKTNAGVSLISTAGQMYNNLIETLTLAINAIETAGYNPVIKGAMWLQGCQDACVEADAPQYANYITHLINDLRADAGELMSEDLSAMPFIICKIGENLEAAAYEDIVREQMQIAAANVNNVRIVETKGMILPDPNDNNDRWHFSAKDMLEIGNRFADVMMQETGKKEVVKYNVTFDAANGVAEDNVVKQVVQWMSVTAPEDDPVKANYEFVAWIDGAGNEFDFEATAIEGDTTITAKYRFLGTYSVSVGQCENGTVAVDKPGSQASETVITITATPNSGYSLDKIFVNGQEITGNTFVLTEDSVVTATFVQTGTFYTISVGLCSGGSVSVDATNVLDNDIVTVTATPMNGYKLKYITVNGTRIDGNTFIATENAEVSAVFEKEAGGCGSSVQPVGIIGFAVVAMALGGLLIALRKKSN